MKLWHPFLPKPVGKGRESGKIKIIVPLRSYPTRNRKFQKTSKKIKNTVMYSFQAKIGLEKMKKGENKNYRFVPTQREIENPKKREIKLKELKYTIMTSFKTKTGWKMQKKRKKKFIAPFRSVPTRRENIKIIVPFRSNPTRNRKLKKNSKKIQRFKKYHYGFISSQNRLEKDEKQIK